MADSEDGSPYATRSNEPDMQGAGVVNPPTETPLALLDALRGIGGSGVALPAPPPGMSPGVPPAMDMAAMLPGMLPPPASQASVFAQALSGGISAMRGQADPVQAMVRDQQQQQNAIMLMLQRMQEHADLSRYREEGRQDARNLHKQNTLNKISEDLIKSDSPEGALLGWKARGQQMAAAGFPLPPDVLEGLARKDIPKETMQQAVRLVGTVPYPELMAMYKGLTPQHEQFLLKAKESDDYRKGLGLESRLEESMRAEEFAIKKQAAALAQVREDRAQQAEARQQQMADVGERRAAETERKNAASEVRSQQMLGLAFRAADRSDASLRLAADRLAAQKAEWDRKFETKDDKKNATFDVMSQLVDEIDRTGGKLDTKGYLPKTSAGVLGGLLSLDISAGKAAANRALFPNDDDWVEFHKILQGGGVGFERSVLNDIGPRGMAAYKGILSFFDNPPTLSALQQATKFMREEIATARGGKSPASHEIVYKSGGKTLVERWNTGDPLPPDAQILTIDGKPPR